MRYFIINGALLTFRAYSARKLKFDFLGFARRKGAILEKYGLFSKHCIQRGDYDQEEKFQNHNWVSTYQ